MTLADKIAALPEWPQGGVPAHGSLGAVIALEHGAALARLELAREVLTMIRPLIEWDAEMMADITRHAPLLPEDQARHDSTETASEKLVAVYDALLKALEEPK